MSGGGGEITIAHLLYCKSSRKGNYQLIQSFVLQIDLTTIVTLKLLSRITVSIYANVPTKFETDMDIDIDTFLCEMKTILQRTSERLMLHTQLVKCSVFVDVRQIVKDSITDALTSMSWELSCMPQKTFVVKVPMIRRVLL